MRAFRTYPLVSWQATANPTAALQTIRVGLEHAVSEGLPSGGELRYVGGQPGEPEERPGLP